MEITWDERNAAEHFEKHKVSFEEGASAVRDENAIIDPDMIHPNRLNYIGTSHTNRILFVVVVEVVDRDELRIITARRATQSERTRYENG